MSPLAAVLPLSLPLSIFRAKYRRRFRSFRSLPELSEFPVTCTASLFLLPFLPFERVILIFILVRLILSFSHGLAGDVLVVEDDGGDDDVVPLENDDKDTGKLQKSLMRPRRRARREADDEVGSSIIPRAIGKSRTNLRQAYLPR